MIYKLAELLTSIRYESLPLKTIHKTKVAIQNYIGGSLPGRNEKLTLAEKNMWDNFGKEGKCSVLGMSGSYSVIAAAAINSAMGEIYLSEDMHNPTSSHPGMLVIPVALAYGESVDASGKQLIEAIVAGYEAMGRIGTALLGPDFANNGLRPASTIAPFGGAVAAMKILGAPTDQIAKAMTIAGNTAAGVMEFVNAGTADICMQNCFAAKSSVMAAELAQRDILAAPTILDGRFGLGWGLTNSPCDWNKVFEARQNGGYVIADSTKETPDAIIIATGSEVSLALDAKAQLAKENVDVRVVSMPCVDLFEQQSAEYKEAVLPKAIRARVAVEAGTDFGWGKYVGLDGAVVTMHGFGASAPAATLFKKFGFTVENVVNTVKSVL